MAKKTPKHWVEIYNEKTGIREIHPVKALPNKPSDLIALALKDLAAAERSKKYKINMGAWHEQLGTSRACSVCFAGAVMAKLNDIGPQHAVFPDSFDPETQNKLAALNLFRLGDVQGGLDDMGLSCAIIPYRGVANYNPGTKGKKFKADMKKVIAVLKKNKH